jgi:hypothetical protein
LQVPCGKDFAKTRVGGALHGSHASHRDRKRPLR